jgi:alpha-L-fucosidase
MKKIKFAKFMYKGEDENETFINNWLDSMFEDALRIYRDELVYYSRLNLPKCIFKK